MPIGTVCRLTVVRTFTYRGQPEEYSNTYSFKGPPPSDDASWNQLLTDVRNKENSIIPTTHTYARAYGYDNNDPKKHHVFAHDFTVPGPPPSGGYVIGTQPLMAGDQAACVWWKLDRLSDKGKPTYLRKYFHGGTLEPTSADSINAIYGDALRVFAGSTGIQAVHGGLTSPGGPQDTDPPPGGGVVTSGAIGWVTTRTLKRRGKRPRTGN
jgi:hypothetical protein